MKKDIKKRNSIEEYRHKKVLITGGLGFIGSNIAHKLIHLDANVTILDNLAPLYGGNMFNIDDIKDKISLIHGDVRDIDTISKLVKDKDFIFHLAGQVSHIDSSEIPFEDLDINCKGYLNVLEACKKSNKNSKIIFSSSRLVLGKTIKNPSDVNFSSNPLSLYGIHKLTAEKYSYLYNKNYGMRTVVLRLTNPYGERQQIKHSKYSIPGWFMRMAMDSKPIKIFGDGNQKRDYIHISDLVDAFLLAGINNITSGKLYDCGFGKSVRFKDMVKSIIKVVKNGNIEYIPWPEDYRKEETGDSEVNIEKLSKDTGWKPKTNLEQGIRKMFDYYKKHKYRYITEK